MIKLKKYLFGIYSKKIDTNSGIIKHKILGITVKKVVTEQNINDNHEFVNIDEIFIKVRAFYNFILNNCSKDCYNLVLHRHLGDSFVILCLKKFFEDKYNTKIHFFVKPRQELLMKMFGIEDYTVFDITKFLDIKDYTTEVEISATQYIDKIEENLYISLFTSIPVLNFPFICGVVDFIKCKSPYKNFIHGWSVMLGLDVEQVDSPKLNVELSQCALNKLVGINLDKVICFAPEANSCKEINIDFWNTLIDTLNQKGYYIIVNSVNKENKIKFANYIDFSLYEFIAVASHSKAVFTIRSGLADILANVQKNCYVFSTEEIYCDYFYMNKIFNLPYKVNEIRVNTNIKSKETKKILQNILKEKF